MNRFLLWWWFVFPGAVFSYGQVLPVRNASVAAGFLAIAPDAVGGAMGGSGTGGRCDLFSLYYNPAKYAFGKADGGIGVFYSPWSASYARELNLSGCSGYWRRRMSSFSAGFRYFSYGGMEMTDEEAVVLATVKPYELSADLAYTLQLSPVWAGSVTFKYICSYLGRLSWNGTGGEERGAGAYAFDVSFLYRSRRTSQGLLWGAGMRLENMGSRLVYREDGDEYLLPAMLKTGGSVEWTRQPHRLSLLCDLGKWMVPADHPAESGRQLAAGSVFTSMARSFEGFSVRDLILCLGVEYGYRDFIRLRCGYSGDNASGNQSFVSFGCGGRWRGWGADLAYLCYTGRANGLDNMLKVSCQYEF